MQRYNAKSSRKPVPKPVHIADYAALDEESLMRLFMDQSGKSREQMTQELNEQWGGIHKFMDYCKQEQVENEKSMGGEDRVPCFCLGRKPNADEKVITLPLTDGLAVRVYGGDLAQSYAFHFDFIDKLERPIKKPSDVRIYTETHGVPCAEVFSIFESLNQSTGQAPWVAQVGHDNPDGQAFIIPEGTLLRIVCGNKRPYLLRIPVRSPDVTVLPIDPVW